jgi:hypothetical protein
MGTRPKEPKQQSGYLPYLLRLWQVDTVGKDDGLGGTVWRCSLDSAVTGERLGFASLTELFEYLHRQTGAHD